MTDTTTIQVTTDTRDDLDALKQSDESYNAVLRRIIDDGGKLWTEAEIREYVRQEIDQRIQERN